MSDWYFTEDERDCIVANVSAVRSTLLAYARSTAEAGEERFAEELYQKVRVLDLVLYKTQRLTETVAKKN